MTSPTNSKLYDHVKSLANKKFKTNGIYRSSWIVKEYKKLGGRYSGIKNKTSGLTRWYKENWIDLNRPIRNSKGTITGYDKCGRKSIKSGKYPLCRPNKRISKSTPKTLKELSKSSIRKAKSLKKKYTYKKNISFTKRTSNKKSGRKSNRKLNKKSKKKSPKKTSNKKSERKSKRKSNKKSKRKSNKKSKKKSPKKTSNKKLGRKSKRKSNKKSGRKSGKTSKRTSKGKSKRKT